MRIGGSRGESPAAATVRQRALRNTRKPIFGVAMITPLVFAGAVSATAPSLPMRMPPVHAAVTPVAAVSPTFPDLTGPAVVSIDRGPTLFHVAEPALSAPPPAMIVNAPGALGIPSIALAAYRSAEQKMAVAAPGCGVSWNLLAGIGRIESGHAGGGAVDARGTAISPIYGPSLDGTLPGNETIIQSSAGNRVTYARAMGPMQFLPGTWARYASDGKGDGVADPQNIFDATLAAARYLCSGGLNLRDQSQVLTAILRYNNSMPYAQNVLGWAAAYATGVVPVDLPPMTGPPPPLGDAHLEHPEGLGPNLPMNVNGLPLDDPLARVPLIDLSSPALGSPQPMFPWMTPTPAQAPAQVPGCTVICISSQSSPAVGPPPPFGAPPPPFGAPQPVAPPQPFAPPQPVANPPFGAPPPEAGPPPAWAWVRRGPRPTGRRAWAPMRPDAGRRRR
ncbi:lytic transglycosylase domain-containing protein, partial [Mycobacterium sp. 1165196.3]|uniref:lytic transglycosylase domain-containing protein n=1 Tax=Mycobacterium sp. 1165196.3 TaxID=1834071 RepID=UPI001E587619